MKEKITKIINELTEPVVEVRKDPTFKDWTNAEILQNKINNTYFQLLEVYKGLKG
jgi:hypothetical protein